MKVRGVLCLLASLTFAFLAPGRARAYKKVPTRIIRDKTALTQLENHASESVKFLEEITTLVKDMLKERRASLCCYDVVTQEDWLSLSLRSALYTTIVSLSRLQDASNEYRRQLNQTCSSCDLTPTYTRCDVTDHRCPSDPDKCISSFQQCDGENDCGDASDEELNICQKNPCGKGILCDKQQVCIPSDYICDGRTDCSDGSDELCTSRPRTDVPSTITTIATPTQCREIEYTCVSSGACVPTLWRCDGEEDCQDGSDEADCTTTTTTTTSTVESDVCKDNPCSHGCVEAPWENQGFFCTCPEGMILQVHDRHTCVSEETTGVKDTSYIYSSVKSVKG